MDRGTWIQPKSVLQVYRPSCVECRREFIAPADEPVFRARLTLTGACSSTFADVIPEIKKNHAPMRGGSWLDEGVAFLFVGSAPSLLLFLLRLARHPFEAEYLGGLRPAVAQTTNPTLRPQSVGITVVSGFSDRTVAGGGRRQSPGEADPEASGGCWEDPASGPIVRGLDESLAAAAQEPCNDLVMNIPYIRRLHDPWSRRPLRRTRAVDRLRRGWAKHLHHLAGARGGGIGSCRWHYGDYFAADTDVAQAAC